MTPVRVPLPARRPSVTRAVTIADRPVAVTVGFYLDGRPGEVFADGPKEGSQMQAVLSDACVLISIALQHGLSPAALAHSLGRSPAPWLGEDATVWASPIGAILEAVRAAWGEDPDALSAPASPVPWGGPAEEGAALPDPIPQPRDPSGDDPLRAGPARSETR